MYQNSVSKTTVIGYHKLHLKICKEYAILMQFKLKKIPGDHYSQGGSKRELKHNKNTHLNSVPYQIQMQEKKSIFEKKIEIHVYM